MSESPEDICRLLTAISSNPLGVTNDDIVKLSYGITAEQRVSELNKLLQEGMIELVYRAKDPTKKASLPEGVVNSDERIVYTIVKEMDSKGIWIRDIRIKSNLDMPKLKKVLKNLQNKKLIKAIMSVNMNFRRASKRKIYMLYNLEPDIPFTGGIWYEDVDFDSEFVNILNQQCLRFLQMKRDFALKKQDSSLTIKYLSCCSLKEVHKFISDLGISKVKLSSKDIEVILKTVVCDGKAERVPLPDGAFAYRAV